jgi:hypothetical protein
MTPEQAAVDLLHAQIADPDTQWSLGTFGGLAEFSRDRDETVLLTQSATGAAAVTARGGIAIEVTEECRPIAFECLTRSSWSQRVAFCLPAAGCAMNRRVVLTELDVDREALQARHRGSVLFDLGLGALQADLCVRLDDPEAAAQLRRWCGRSVWEPGNPAMGLVLQVNPHRVFISRIGRIEVYQPIPPPSGKSPDGPHTHVLPKLLKSGRSHAATEPIPDGWIPCAHLYPRHPLSGSHLFDAACHQAFQGMIECFGLPQYRGISRRVADAVRSGTPPSNLAIPPDRHSRTAVRATLRQMKAAGMATEPLKQWLAAFDDAIIEDDPDEALLAPAH